jgi:hypothetical protein
MKLWLLIFYLMSTLAAQAAGMAVIDIENLAVAQQNARQTRDIVNNSDQLSRKADQILQALTGSRTGSLTFPADGLGGAVSIASAPSLGAFVQDDRMNLGTIGAEARRTAAFMINGLMLSTTLQQARADGRPTSVNELYRSRLRGGVLLAALAEQAARNSSARSQQIAGAVATIGQTRDVKASIDQNTRVQLETVRAVNDLIAMQSATSAAANLQSMEDVTRASQVGKLLQYKHVNPFRRMATKSRYGN